MRTPDDAYAKPKAAKLVAKFKAPPKEDRFETLVSTKMVNHKKTKKKKRSTGRR